MSLRSVGAIREGRPDLLSRRIARASKQIALPHTLTAYSLHVAEAWCITDEGGRSR